MESDKTKEVGRFHSRTRTLTHLLGNTETAGDACGDFFQSGDRRTRSVVLKRDENDLDEQTPLPRVVARP